MPVTRGQRWTAARVKTFAKLWNSGTHPAAIAEVVGLLPRSVAVMAATLRRRGVDLAPRRRGPKGIVTSPERIKKFVSLWNSGASSRAIAAALGIRPGSVQSIGGRIKAVYGIDLKPRPRGPQSSKA